MHREDRHVLCGTEVEHVRLAARKCTMKLYLVFTKAVVVERDDCRGLAEKRTPFKTLVTGPVLVQLLDWDSAP